MIKKYELIHQSFFEIREVCSAIGLHIFSNLRNNKENTSKDVNETKGNTKIFHMNYDGGKATAEYDGNQIIVKKGSLISLCRNEKFPNYKVYRKLLSDGMIQNNRFAYDVPFNSPTEAGNIIAKHNMDGRINWKMKNGMTIKDVFG